MDTKEMAYYSNPGGTLEKLNNLKPLISRNEELYISKEAKKENALASEGKSCRPQKINQPRSQGSLLPALQSETERDPGKHWSCVSQNQGDYKQTIWERGR